MQKLLAPGGLRDAFPDQNLSSKAHLPLLCRDGETAKDNEFSSASLHAADSSVGQKNRKHLQESKMRMHLSRNLDWELLIKKPSARPTCCNLSASSPMTVPITHWASEALASLMLLQHSRLFLYQHYFSLRSQAVFQSLIKCHRCKEEKGDTFSP